MTARTAPGTDSATRTLRLLLRADAVSCLFCGALLVPASAWFSDLLGLPTALLVPLGLFLLCFGTGLGLLSSGRGLTRVAVRAVVGTNTAWAVGTGALGSGVLVDPNASGTALLLVQAAAVAVLASLQAAALRRADTV